MQFTPEDIEAIENSPIYVDNIRQKTFSTFTSAALIALLNNVGMRTDNLPIQKLLIFLINQRLREETAQLRLNEEVFAAIIEEGGDPRTNSYPLKFARSVNVVAGGAGAVAADTLIAAVTGKKIFIEEFHVNLATDTASGGILLNLRDGAGGSTLCGLSVSINKPDTRSRPLMAGTAATLLELVGDPSTFAAMDDNDVVITDCKYREV